MTTRSELGADGERRAAALLEALGWRVLDKNWRVGSKLAGRTAELDLVMDDGSALVFVEVKARRGVAHGSPAEAVTVRKQSQIARAASAYLAAHPEFAERDCRFDVVAVSFGPGPVRMEHLRDAFRL